MKKKKFRGSMGVELSFEEEDFMIEAGMEHEREQERGDNDE